MRHIHSTPGRFVWHELVTSDVEAARRFYGELLGWEIEAACGLDRPYNYLTRNRQAVGGLVLRPGPHVPPHVLGYVSVPDFDDTLDRAREHRAAVLASPLDSPLGRTAVLQDPQGAVFGLCSPKLDNSGEAPSVGDSAFGWDQLESSDAERAAAFYGSVLGWQRALSPAGDPSVTTFKCDGAGVAGLRQAPQGTFARWLVHVGVDDLRSARERARELGGTILIETIVHADMGELCVLHDNLGAIFGLFEHPGR